VKKNDKDTEENEGARRSYNSAGEATRHNAEVDMGRAS